MSAAQNRSHFCREQPSAMVKLTPDKWGGEQKKLRDKLVSGKLSLSQTIGAGGSLKLKIT